MSVSGGVLTSDAIAAPDRRDRAKMPNGAVRSSVPPSESGAAFSDGFGDDEVVGARGTDRNRPKDPMARAIPRVVDKVGEKVAEEFENFMEQ